MDRRRAGGAGPARRSLLGLGVALAERRGGVRSAAATGPRHRERRRHLPRKWSCSACRTPREPLRC